MLTNLLGGVTNIVLDAVFMIGFGWGIFGAALATVIAQAVSAIWILSYFLSPKTEIRLLRKYMKLEFEIIASILKIGISSFVIQIAGSLARMVSNKALIQYGGEIALSAMTAILSIAELALMPVFGINQGTQPVLGYNFGIKNYSRVKGALFRAMIVATAYLTISSSIIKIFPNFFINFFVKADESREFYNMVKEGLPLFILMFPIIGIRIVSISFYQATNRAVRSLLLSFLRQILILIPLYLLLPKFFGLRGIWMAVPISDALSVTVTSILIFGSIKEMTKQEELQACEDLA